MEQLKQTVFPHAPQQLSSLPNPNPSTSIITSSSPLPPPTPAPQSSQFALDEWCSRVRGGEGAADDRGEGVEELEVEGALGRFQKLWRDRCCCCCWGAGAIALTTIASGCCCCACCWWEEAEYSMFNVRSDEPDSCEKLDKFFCKADEAALMDGSW